MTEENTGASRRLHGVLLADMTGFSRLMGEDESRAVAALMRIRDVFAVVVPRHAGTLDVFVGDCFVALFDSAVDAVQAAIQIQSDLAAQGDGDRVRIRIGIHLGDVVRAGTEILGDSVNIAARIQAIAPPGGITISEDVYRAVRNRVRVPVRDLGAKSLKNIRGKMRVYVLDPDGAADSTPARAALPARRTLALTLGGLAAVLLVAGAAVGYRAGWFPMRVAAPAASRLPAVAPRPEGETVTVGVTGVSALGEVPPWMQDTTRDGLNTLLSKVHNLRVFSREKIDFLRQRRGLTEIEVAETLGIEKMISGSLALQNGEVLLDVRVVDISTGLLDASESLRGAPEELIELQNQLASSVIAALGVRLSPDEETALFAARTRETLDGYRRMADTFGEAPESQPPVRREKTSWLWGATAWADDGADQAQVTAMLEAYRVALEKKDVDAVAAVHVGLTDEQRAGFDRYFASADGLRVSVGDVDILLDGDEGVVTFTRRDVFRDRDSDKDVEAEVRLSSIVVRKDGHWLMRGVRRS
ncbi:MAG: adenylate/guanylate cyclase domain-containing protein [Candidatus Binatia bacterium]